MSHLTFFPVFMLHVFFGVLFLPGNISALEDHRIALLEKAEQAIHSGFPTHAEQLMSSATSLSPASASWRVILRARIMHESGDCVASMASLHQVISAIRNDPSKSEVLAEAYLEYARICRSLFWIEPYNKYNDSVGMLMTRHQFPDHIRYRYYTNRVQYLTLLFFMDKVVEPMDSMMAIGRRVRRDIAYRYQTEHGIAATISLERNRHRHIARYLSDSIFREINKSGPGTMSYPRAVLWRSAANFFMDEVLPTERLSDTALVYFNKAQQCIDRALGIFRHVYSNNIPDQAMILDLKGYLYQKSGKPTYSMVLLRQAEELLTHPSWASFHYFYVHYVTGFYQIHVINRVMKGSDLTAEQRRQLERFVKIAADWSRWEDTNRDSLDHYRFNYTVDPHSIIVQLCYWLHEKSGDPKLVDMAFRALEQSKFRRLRQRMLELSGIKDPGVPSIAQVQQRLGKDEALISTADLNGFRATTYFMIITRDTVAFRELIEASVKVAQSRVMESEEYICRDVNTLKTSYHQVWQTVFKPMEPFLKGIRQIRILPSGYTSGYTFELMIPDTTGIRKFGDIKYLRDRYRIRYDYSWSISEIRRLVPDNHIASRKKVAFIPDYRQTPYYRLRFFEEMAGQINRDFDFHVLHHKSATMERFSREFANAQLLLLAAHGYSTGSFALDQFIVMDSTRGGEAHLLDPHYLIRARTNADLAVLSICLGGMSIWNHLDIRNLAYWFSYAGAKSALYAYWKIDDRSTAIILKRFYVHLADGMDRYDALHTAQDDYLRGARSDAERNPIYWGGLTMIGEDGPLDVRKRKYGWAWISIFSFVWCLLLISFRR
jgi:CHAT domain-containing protein